jgi:hypothetical protein
MVKILSRFFILFSILSLALSSCGDEVMPTNSGEWSGDWESFLDSGSVFTLEGRDEFVLASTNQGLLISYDHGEYFEPKALPGLESATINSIILRTDRWFVAANNGKVWESIDYGNSWQLVGTAPGTGRITAPESGGLYISGTNGREWIKSDTGLGGQQVRSVIYAKGHIYASTNQAGAVYISTDFGESWARRDSGFTAPSILDLDDAGNDVLAVVGDKGVMHLQHNGMVWSPRTNGFPAKMYAQTILAERNFAYVGGSFSDANESNVHVLYRTKDRGQTWEAADQGLSRVSEVTTITGTDDYIVIGTRGQGIWRRKRD